MDLAQMPFTLRCDQCIVKSVLQDQQCTFWSKKFAHSRESVVDKERPGRHQNNTAARSFLIDNTLLTISKLITPSVYCYGTTLVGGPLKPLLYLASLLRYCVKHLAKHISTENALIPIFVF